MSESAHILIVGDEAREHELLAQELIRQGFCVECCASGTACLKAVERAIPALILLDVVMPQINGLEVLRQLRQRWDADVLPVILVTAKPESDDVVAGLAAGANDYITKPLNLPVLVARIRTCLRIRELSASSERERELQRLNAALAAEGAERQRIEQALCLYKEQFEKAFRACPDGLALSYLDSGKIIDVNDTFSRMFGYAREEIVGKLSAELGLIAHPPDRDRAIAQLRATGVIRDFEAPARRRTGEIFPVSVSAESLELEGRPCVLTITRDITERERVDEAMRMANERLEKRVAERTADLLAANEALRESEDQLRRANNALRESEERFRTMANNAPVLLWMTGEDGLCTFVNRSWTELTGRSVEHWLGIGWREAIHPDDREQRVAMWQRAFAAREPIAGEYRVRRADGVYRWLYSVGVPRFRPDGSFAGYIGSSMDITERREAEQVLRQTADELEQRVSQRTAELAHTNAHLAAEVAERRAANQQLMTYQSKLRALSAQVAIAEERERRRIARGLHDEIGQSLALVKMRLGSFRELATDPEKARNFDEIRAAVENAIVHIRSLTFDLGSRILYEFGLEAAIENLVEGMHKHGLKPFFSDDRQPKPLDEEVRVIVFQAVRELLHNITKHARARRVWVSLDREGEFLRVQVRDDGRGFDSRTADQTISKSNGFGLFNVREQLDYIGGSVKLESSPTRGTNVVILAPLAQQSEALNPASSTRWVPEI